MFFHGLHEGDVIVGEICVVAHVLGIDGGLASECSVEAAYGRILDVVEILAVDGLCVVFDDHISLIRFVRS